MKKLLLSIITCLLFSLSSFAQQQVVQEWVQRFNGPDSLFDVGTAIDVFGSVYVTGRTITPSGERIVVIKYTSTGTQSWASFFVGHQPVGIVLDQSGNAYITGISSTGTYLTLKYDTAGILQWADSVINTSIPTSIALDLSNNVYVTGADSSGNRITTIKYNSSGVLQWSVIFQNVPTAGSARGNDITVDASGNVYVTGLSNNGTSFDYTTLKYSSSGVQHWVSFYNGPANGGDGANAIALDAGGNIYVTGSSAGIGTGSDYATIQYNANGVQQWVARYNGPGNSGDLSRDIAVDGLGNINVTGNSAGSGTQDDYATIQYSNAGTQNWIQRYNGTANSADQAHALTVDNSGNIYVTGFSDNSGTGQDYATLKYDVNGNQQWLQLYNGPANSTDQANAIVIDSIGSVYITGLSLGVATNFDIATIKYSAPLSVSITTTNATCNGANNGSAGAVVSGGISSYSYQWSNGQTTSAAVAMAAGLYTVTVTDSLNNTVIGIALINEPPLDTLSTSAACSQLFISEYVSGTTHHTALEFFNPTKDTVLLNKYFARIFMNGAPTPLIVQLVGILLPKQTHVIANPNADAAILAKANQTSNKINFNGDDAIQFVQVKNNININIDSIEGHGGNPHDIFDTLQLDTIDQIGVTDVYPGNQGWSVGGSGSTKNGTLIRNYGVTSGVSSDWSCGQYQWQIMPQNDISNLGIHQNLCSVVNDISFSFANPIETGTSPKYFEFDIMVEANNNSTYFDYSEFYIQFNSSAFGTYITSNNNIITSLGTNFNNSTYNGQWNVVSDIDTNAFWLSVGADINATPFNRTNITTTLQQLVHIKMEISLCNQMTDIQFIDTITSAGVTFYSDLPTLAGNYFNYDNVSYLSTPLNQLLCPGLQITDFTSPVNAGIGDILTITGNNFGSARGNGQVKFKNADNGGSSYFQLLDNNDFVSWTDNQVQIKMPSRIDTIGGNKLNTPGSGDFIVKNDVGDSVPSNLNSSGQTFQVYYSIHNATISSYKYKSNLLNKNNLGGYTIRVDTSMSNHPERMMCLSKAMREWKCYTTINWIVGNDTTLNTFNADGISTVFFTNSLSDPNFIGQTQRNKLYCTSPTTSIINDFDIGIKYLPNWFYDTIGTPLSAGQYDFLEVITHELGHALGLEHVNDNIQIMYYTSQYSSTSTITNRKTLQPYTSDVNGGFDQVITSVTNLSGQCGFVDMSPDNSGSCSAGINELLENNFYLTLYPNPTEEGNLYVGFESPTNLNVQIFIYDIVGKIVYQEYLNNRHETHYTHTINVSNLSQGMYFVGLIIDKNKVSGKFIKN